MGYNTYFSGEMNIEPPLTLEELNIINTFSAARHDGKDFPGIWCQWVASNDGKCIEWDTNEKFYEAKKWLEYLIKNYLSSKICNGDIYADGDAADDHWLLEIRDNVVTQKEGELVYK